MDWTEKTEQKKKLRKMARRMLWADFKGVVCGWKCILLVCLYVLFILLPYYKNADDINGVSFFYVLMWVFIAVCALYEKPFNYLPLTTGDIVYYLKYRTNLLAAWLTLSSAGTGAVMYAAGVDVFWERGLVILCFLLMAQEGWLFEMLYGLAYERNENGTVNAPKARKLRIILYSTYAIVVLFAGMFVFMFMKYGETSKFKLLAALAGYLIMYIFRVDISHWVVQIREYVKPAERVVFATQQQIMAAQQQNPQK